MRRTLFILLLVLVIGYGLFEARRIIAGPELRIDSPTDGAATSSTAVTISGTALNISFLTINDAPAYTDENGHFSETITPPLGYAVITVAAADRFGRRTSTSVTITAVNYCPVA